MNARERLFLVDAQASPDTRNAVIEAENFESIHNHSAYARLSRVKA